MDDDLAVQLPYVRRVCEVFGLPRHRRDGLRGRRRDRDPGRARRSSRACKVVVVSGDKDLLQLVSDDVLVISPGREGAPSILYDRKTVEEKWGVPPERVVDVLALVGDSVDNVPGVPGIGEKGARDLVRSSAPLEDVLANADKIKRNAYREGLIKHTRDAAILSKRLVTLRADVPVTLDLEALKRRPPNRAAANALFTELEFVALAKEYAPEAGPSRTEYARPAPSPTP